jgi:GT2 family glycosyltransferase
MYNNTDIGHLMPKVLYPDGQIQYLCKLIPTPFDLIFRRFLPENWTKKRRDKFELRASGYSKIMDVPYLSGCFMFLRTKALEEIGLFDERFFMYPEDIDLTRRIHRKYRTVFYPEVSVIHNHAQSSYKSLRMLWIHISNMIKYFNKWGWIFDNERKKINKAILNK